MWWWNFPIGISSEYLRRRLTVKLIFSDSEEIFSDDLLSLLKYLEIINDLRVATVFEKYKDIKINKYFYYKNSRPIDNDRKLLISRITKESPIELTLVLGSIGALWALVQVIEKIANWNLNRQKLKLEVENLKSKNQEIKGNEEIFEEEYITYISKDLEIHKRIKRISKELSEIKLFLKDLEIKE